MEMKTVRTFLAFSSTWNSGNINVLAEGPSRIPNEEALFNGAEIFYSTFLQVINGHDDDQFFGTTLHGLKGNRFSSTKEKAGLKRLIPLFSIKNSKLLYNRNVYVPQRAMQYILEIIHESRIGGYVKFAKNMFRLKCILDTKRAKNKWYCIRFKQYEHSNAKELESLKTPEILERR